MFSSVIDINALPWEDFGTTTGGINAGSCFSEESYHKYARRSMSDVELAKAENVGDFKIIYDFGTAKRVTHFQL